MKENCYKLAILLIKRYTEKQNSRYMEALTASDGKMFILGQPFWTNKRVSYPHTAWLYIHLLIEFIFAAEIYSYCCYNYSNKKLHKVNGQCSLNSPTL